jgi:succinate dehydrogenase/fumarate reductase cytochrome b subunit
VEQFRRTVRLAVGILVALVYVWVAAVHLAAGVRRRKALRRTM